MNSKFFLFVLFLLSASFVLASEKIDVNTASLEDLDRLAGVGPVIAQKIIDARPFSSVEDLIKVKGIGPKKLEDIKKQGLAWVSGETTEPSNLPEETKRESPMVTPKKPSPPPKSATVDINSAPLKELVRIVHIGETRAQQLISLRPFYSLEDLERIKGIGEKSVGDIKKQGLAWVDPNLKRPPMEESDLSKKGAASIADVNQGSKSLTTFLLALTLSVFFGIIILIIKRRLKKKAQDSLRF